MNSKKIMILGAGNTVFPLIEQAKKLGLYTIVVSPPGDYIGLTYADCIVHCDFRATEKILESARMHAIDGIACTGTDIVVPVIGQIVDELDLNGTGYSSAKKCTDKWLMKRALINSGVSTALGHICESENEINRAAISLGFPLMSKAVDSSGSQGVFRVDCMESLYDAWEASRDASETGRVILEQFLSGIEIGAQTIVKGNRVEAIFLHNDQLLPPPNYTPIGHSMPCNLAVGLQNRIRLEVQKAISALEIQDAVSNVDIIVVDETPYIIEVGARMGATCLPESISIFSGFDAYQCVLALALGETIEISEPPHGQPNASRLIESPQNGFVQNITIPEDIHKHPNLHKLSIYAKPGDHVRQFRVGPDRIGDLIVTGKSSVEAEQLADELVSKISVQLQ